MAPKVPPLARFPQGSAEAWSPRLTEQMTPRALWELIKEDPTWGVLVNDPSGAFSKGDIISVRYQKYLHEVLPIMVSQDASFKTAIDMLAEQTGGKALSPQSKGVVSAPASSPKSAKLRKEVMKDQGKDGPKLREAVDEKDHPDLKAIDEKDATFHEVEPKALDMDVEHEEKSITNRARDFTKATERSSSEPIAPKRPDQEHALLRQGAVQMLRAEQVAERVVFVETRPQVQNKEIAIQTEEVRAAPSEPLLQPLLSRAPAAKPKARRKPKDAKKEVPIQYQDCSCSRIFFSSTMKFILACMAALVVVWCGENCNKVLAFFGGSMVKEPVAPSTKHSKSKTKHTEKEPKEPKHHESHESEKHPQSGPKPVVSPVKSVKPSEPRHEEKPESHSHEGVRREGEVVPTTSPPTDLQLAKEERAKDLKELERLEEEQARTARVGELARLSQKEHEKMAKNQNKDKDSNLRQAALDAEVQASAAQRELDEDADIRKQKEKVKDAQALVDQLETAKMDQQGFLAVAHSRGAAHG